MDANKLPTIALVGTGGTIASTAADTTTMVDYAITEPVSAILASIPEINQLAHVRFHQPFNVDSRCIDNEMLLGLAQHLDRILAESEVDAAVITHGTDTLEETAYFLSLTLKSPKAVVMTGAMRPSSARSADGPLNLYSAVLVALSQAAPGMGVLVAMNDDIHAARYVCKTHTTQVHAFESHEQGAVGCVVNGAVQFFNTPVALHTVKTDFKLGELRDLPSVDILYDHQNAGLHLFEAAIAAGVQGIVLAGVGNGNMSRSAEQGMALASKAGVVCVRGSRVGSGFVSTTSVDGHLGLVSAGSLNPHKARILLMLALTRTRDSRRIQWYFDHY
jgi:L-asparaginase